MSVDTRDRGHIAAHDGGLPHAFDVLGLHALDVRGVSTGDVGTARHAGLAVTLSAEHRVTRDRCDGHFTSDSHRRVTRDRVVAFACDESRLIALNDDRFVLRHREVVIAFHGL